MGLPMGIKCHFMVLGDDKMGLGALFLSSLSGQLYAFRYGYMHVVRTT